MKILILRKTCGYGSPYTECRNKLFQWIFSWNAIWLTNSSCVRSVSRCFLQRISYQARCFRTPQDIVRGRSNSLIKSIIERLEALLTLGKRSKHGFAFLSSFLSHNCWHTQTFCSRHLRWFASIHLCLLARCIVSIEHAGCIFLIFHLFIQFLFDALVLFLNLLILLLVIYDLLQKQVLVVLLARVLNLELLLLIG